MIRRIPVSYTDEYGNVVKASYPSVALGRFLPLSLTITDGYEVNPPFTVWCLDLDIAVPGNDWSSSYGGGNYSSRHIDYYSSPKSYCEYTESDARSYSVIGETIDGQIISGSVPETIDWAYTTLPNKVWGTDNPYEDPFCAAAPVQIHISESAGNVADFAYGGQTGYAESFATDHSLGDYMTGGLEIFAHRVDLGYGIRSIPYPPITKSFADMLAEYGQPKLSFWADGDLSMTFETGTLYTDLIASYTRSTNYNYDFDTQEWYDDSPNMHTRVTYYSHSHTGGEIRLLIIGSSTATWPNYLENKGIYLLPASTVVTYDGNYSYKIGHIGRKNTIQTLQETYPTDERNTDRIVYADSIMPYYGTYQQLIGATYSWPEQATGQDTVIAGKCIKQHQIWYKTDERDPTTELIKKDDIVVQPTSWGHQISVKVWRFDEDGVSGNWWDIERTLIFTGVPGDPNASYGGTDWYNPTANKKFGIYGNIGADYWEDMTYADIAARVRATM